MATSVAVLCKERGITFPELVQRSGLDENKVAAIMLGRWTPSPTERQKIAQVFDLPIDQIVWGHKTPIQHIYGQGPS